MSLDLAKMKKQKQENNTEKIKTDSGTMRIKTNMFSEKQLIKLLKIRLKKLGTDTITNITFEDKLSDGFTCIVSYKNWDSERKGMTLTKFYPEEINYLLKIGVLKIKNNSLVVNTANKKYIN